MTGWLGRVELLDGAEGGMMADMKIVCCKCLALNNVPESRLHDAPKCGKCHAELFSGQVLELTDANFLKVVSGSNQPLLVLFWAPWCGYCQKTDPEFRHAGSVLEPAFRLASVNTESNRMTAGRYAIKALPTLLLFKEGKEIARQPGAITKAQIVSWARSQRL